MPYNRYIHSYVVLRKGQATLNGKILPVGQGLEGNDFFKALYQFLQLDYPKFFKMDELCKLAFLCAELLLKEHPLEGLSETETAIVLANASSTLETDRKHQESIRDEANYFPSPAVFVYTLPNITIGEVAIRHKLKGENTFFIQERYDLRFMSLYGNSLLRQNRTQKLLSGWVEYNPEGLDGFMYLAGKEETGLSLEHTEATLEKLYKTGLSI